MGCVVAKSNKIHPHLIKDEKSTDYKNHGNNKKESNDTVINVSACRGVRWSVW